MAQAVPQATRRQRPQATAGLEPYSGPWTYAEAAHLARRTMYGARKADVNMLMSLTPSVAVDMLLAPPPAPKPAAPIDYVGNEDSWTTANYTNSNNDNKYTTFLQTWVFQQMLMQSVSINEKLTCFWANHFATGHTAVLDARYMYKQNAMLRANALGSFRHMVDEIVYDPAMLRYLNNNLNTKQSVNENFARELQELFTIGKGPEIAPGNYTTYTEDDVKAAARVLTGWSDVVNPPGAKFTDSAHVTADKQFSSAYGNTVITGRSGEIGARMEVDALLNMIMDQPATAKYIVSKLYRWFVSTHIDAWTQTNIIDPLAADFKTGNYEVKPVLDKLFKSAHFYDQAIRGAMITSTYDLCVGTLRALPMICMITPFDASPDYRDTFLPTATNATHWALRRFRATLATMQQTMLQAPNVAGWPAYYQEPLYDQLWVNADTLQKRIKYLDDLAITHYLWDEEYGYFLVDVIEFAKQTSDPASAQTIVNEWADMLFAVKLIDAQKAEALKVFVGTDTAGWTATWNAYLANPTSETNINAVEGKLRPLLRHYFGLAEYQLM